MGGCGVIVFVCVCVLWGWVGGCGVGGCVWVFV